MSWWQSNDSHLPQQNLQYLEGEQMKFGEALAAMDEGYRVYRHGWNGKSMFLFLIGDWDFSITNSKRSNWAADENNDWPVLPFIAMKTADHKIVPWLASQTDILADDWAIV